MKSFIVFLFMLFSLNAHTQGIEFFHGTFDEAKAESKKTGRLIFMDCFTTWCGPCKRLSSQVFTQEEVGNFFNKSFINVKFDMEKGEGPSIAKEYGISAYPTLLFIDGAGKLMHRKVGGTDPAGLIAEGQIAAKKNDLSPVYGAQFDAGDHSPELVYKYIKALNDAGKSSSKVANQYFKEKKNFDSQPDQMMSDLNGDALATSLQVGTPLTKTYEFILPTEAGWWVAKNCSVVAFISDYNQKPEINGQQLNVGYVLQAVQAKIK